MGFNELANNSLKHGAFSRKDGSVKVNWETTQSDETDILYFEWIESHGGVLPESIDGGLGSKVLKLAIPYELEGTAEIVVIENGIHFKTSIPIKTIKVRESFNERKY
jgi:two-component sensor histidine kinase